MLQSFVCSNFGNWSIESQRSVIYNNVYEPEGHYQKQNKLDIERQKLHDLTEVCNLKKLNTEKQKGQAIWDKEIGKMGRSWSKSTKLQSCKVNKTRDLMFRVMTI